MRDFEVHVFEVVNPGTANHYRFRGHQLRRTLPSRFGPPEGAQKASGALGESSYYKAGRRLWSETQSWSGLFHVGPDASSGWASATRRVWAQRALRDHRGGGRAALGWTGEGTRPYVGCVTETLR